MRVAGRTFTPATPASTTPGSIIPASATPGEGAAALRATSITPLASDGKILSRRLITQAGATSRLVVASDHRGFRAKGKLLSQLGRFGYQVIDLGCDGERNCDYPDYAAPAARMVAAGEADVALLLDGSGIGMGIVANKIDGIRAATAHDEITARIAREHNHCNVLCVGTDLVSDKALLRIIEIFLTTPFAQGRHVRRVAKISALEAEERRPDALKMSS